MRPLFRTLAGLLAAAALAVGCNEGPAEAALKFAEEELAAARTELARYVPRELERLEAAIRDARAEVGKGHYTDALRAAQGLPARIAAASATAEVKKEELARAWAALARALDPAIEALVARMAEAAAPDRMPKGMQPDGLAAAQAELGAIRVEWARAGEAFRSGDVPEALRAAQDVKTRVEALSAAAGRARPVPKPAAPPAGAPAPAPAPAAAPAPGTR